MPPEGDEPFRRILEARRKALRGLSPKASAAEKIFVSDKDVQMSDAKLRHFLYKRFLFMNIRKYMHNYKKYAKKYCFPFIVVLE